MKHAVVTISGGVGDIWVVDRDVKVHIIDYDNLKDVEGSAEVYICPHCGEEAFDEEWNVFAEILWEDQAAVIGAPHWEDSLFVCPYCNTYNTGAKLEHKEWDNA